MVLGRTSPRQKGADGMNTGPESANAALKDRPVNPRYREKGLTAEEVRERIKQGKTNDVRESTSRSASDIIRANVFNRFNAILAVLLVVILMVGSPKDALFGMVLVANTLIGIVQELRAKRTLDRLSLITAPRARVIRGGEGREIPKREIVLDDLVELQAGDQVLVDGTVLASTGLEIDESLLTGESVPVFKHPGDKVFSGSFVSSGSGRFRATHVGADSYAMRVASEAKRFTLVKSDLRQSIDTILKWVVWAMIPISIAFTISQLLSDNSLSGALVSTVAGLVAMIPQGLVLLTSIVFAVSAMTLARRHVLVQELPAVEGLARVDVICLDKTGTLTEGSLELKSLESLGPEEGLEEVLGALAAGSPAMNATMRAIASAFPPPQGWRVVDSVPFSSAKKWSAITFEGRGTWYLGAPDVLLEDRATDDPVRKRAEELAESGLRVLLLSRSGNGMEGEGRLENLRPAALVVIEEKIRPDAAETLDYFKEQGVGIRVISGDNPNTVASVAGQVGVPGAEYPVDARRLPDDPEGLAEVMQEKSVFGRVVPQQKRGMVHALQSREHVVAMTGDGVNDTLALKDADMGIAMGSGAPSTKSVAQLILLDGRFSTLPGVVAEGRRVMANMERVANLFITKTVYAALLALGIAFIAWPFPFLPRHITLVGSLTIGIPAFVLSFEKSKERYRPGLLERVMLFSLPAGFIAFLATFIAYVMARNYIPDTIQQSTVAVIVLTIVGFWVLFVLIRPFTPRRGILLCIMIFAFCVVLLWPWMRNFFQLEFPGYVVFILSLGIASVACALLELVEKYMKPYTSGRRKLRLPRWWKRKGRGREASRTH